MYCCNEGCRLVLGDLVRLSPSDVWLLPVFGLVLSRSFPLALVSVLLADAVISFVYSLLFEPCGDLPRLLHQPSSSNVSPNVGVTLLRRFILPPAGDVGILTFWRQRCYNVGLLFY
jgi:hypothetical protein